MTLASQKAKENKADIGGLGVFERSVLTTEWRNVITTGSLNIFFVSGRRLTDKMAEFIDGCSMVRWSFSFLQIMEKLLRSTVFWHYYAVLGGSNF